MNHICRNLGFENPIKPLRCNLIKITTLQNYKITVKYFREADELANASQREVGRRIGERLTDLTFWVGELQNELEKMIQESNMLQDSRRLLEKTLQDLEAPLHIAQECLYHRENRTGNAILLTVITFDIPLCNYTRACKHQILPFNSVSIPPPPYIYILFKYEQILSTN